MGIEFAHALTQIVQIISNFHPLEVVGRVIETPFQMDEK